MDQPTEVELKLEFAPADRERLIASPLLGDGGRHQRLRATYFDTPALDLRRAGFALRIRDDGSQRVQTLKSADGASLLTRAEWEWPVSGDHPELGEAGPLKEHVPVERLARVAPLFVTSIDRVVRPLELPDATLVECAIDIGTVGAGKRHSPVSEVELELIQGSPQGLFDLARQLDAQVPVRLGVQSKSARGYALIDGRDETAAKAEPVRLSAAMTAAHAFTVIVAACLDHYRRNEALLLEHGWPGAIHQGRVALRRLRSAFSLFGPLFAGDRQAAAIIAELRWLAGEFGAVRDLDVLLPQLAPRDREALAPIRDSRFAHLRSQLEAGRIRLLPIDIVEWLEVGGWRKRLARPHLLERPVADFAGKRLDKLRRRIKREGRHLTSIDEEHRHDVRKQAKKLRYASEFLVSVYPGRKARRRLDRLLGRIEELQDGLGRLNDEAVARELLALYVSGASPPQLSPAKRRSLLKRAEASFDALVDCKPFWRA